MGTLFHFLVNHLN